jgi:hypothetical protein
MWRNWRRKRELTKEVEPHQDARPPQSCFSMHAAPCHFSSALDFLCHNPGSRERNYDITALDLGGSDAALRVEAGA